MRSIKYMALAAILSVGVFCAIMYSSSCTKDACKGVTCLHHGICSGGSCTCIDPVGIGGQNCEIIYKNLYANTYVGNTVVSYIALDTAMIDSGYMNHTDNNNKIVFSSVADTVYSKMNLVWTDNNVTMLQTVITLANNTSTGSTFKVSGTGGPGGAYNITGTGNVNSTNASLNLTAISTDTTKPSMTLTLSNFSKQ